MVKVLGFCIAVTKIPKIKQQKEGKIYFGSWFQRALLGQNTSSSHMEDRKQAARQEGGRDRMPAMTHSQ
jgi:hypothetical protein